MKSKKGENANEAQGSYGNNHITFFSSFEEMNEYDLKEMASQTPVQHLQNITGVIAEMYKIELKHPIDSTIYFK